MLKWIGKALDWLGFKRRPVHTTIPANRPGPRLRGVRPLVPLDPDAPTPRENVKPRHFRKRPPKHDRSKP